MESVESLSSLLLPCKSTLAACKPALGGWNGRRRTWPVLWEETCLLSLGVLDFISHPIYWIGAWLDFQSFFSALHHFCLFGCRPRRKQHPAPSIETTASSRKCWATTRPRCCHKLMPRAQTLFPTRKTHLSTPLCICLCFYGFSMFPPQRDSDYSFGSAVLLSWIQHYGPLQGIGQMGARRMQNAWSWHALATALGFTSGAWKPKCPQIFKPWGSWHHCV